MVGHWVYPAMAATAHTGTMPAEVAGWVALGAAWAWVVSMSRIVIDRMAPERAAHRFVGSFAGVAAFALIHLYVGTPLLLTVLACLAFIAEVTVVRNYGITVSATTPLALLMGGALTQPLGPTVSARLLESIVGVACALAALWLVQRRGSATVLRTTEHRVHRAVDELADVRIADAHPDTILALRRDLQFELHGNQLAAEQAARDLPEWTRVNWPTHATTQQPGYATLAQP